MDDIDLFWWKNITGPKRFADAVEEALLDGKNVFLSVPADLPWRHRMREVIETACRDSLVNRGIMFDRIDVKDDCGDQKPGDFILSRYARRHVMLGYRPTAGSSLQEYIKNNEVLRERVLWVKGIDVDHADEWYEFCRQYTPDGINNGIFVLELPREYVVHGARSLTYVSYTQIVTRYDVHLLCSFWMDKRPGVDNVARQYLASLASHLCAEDAEIAVAFLDAFDMRNETDVIETLGHIAEKLEFARRGAEASSSHILSLVRCGDQEAIMRRVWQAQLETFFPIIELRRIQIIEKIEQELVKILSTGKITQYEQIVSDPRDIELGTLTYMMACRGADGNYILYIPDEALRREITDLRDCRNALAHANCIPNELLAKLMKYSL